MSSTCIVVVNRSAEMRGSWKLRLWEVIKIKLETWNEDIIGTSTSKWKLTLKLIWCDFSTPVVTSSLASTNIFLAVKLSNIISVLHRINNLILCFIPNEELNFITYAHIHKFLKSLFFSYCCLILISFHTCQLGRYMSEENKTEMWLATLLVWIWC